MEEQMLNLTHSKDSSILKRTVSIVATIALSVAGVNSVSLPASATTPIDVFYQANTIATTVPASTTVNRNVIGLPAAASVTSTRAGYTFGGWSLEAGGAALAGATYDYTGTATRIDLHAVWNTTINYNLNSATSGTLDGGKTQDTYRFGQTLTLPISGTLARTGYTFGGWIPATTTGTRSTSYTAASTAVGNPTLYAAWFRSLSFATSGSTSGTAPATMEYLADGAALTLPIASETTLRRAGYELEGWSTTLGGFKINTTTFIPTIAAQTLYPVWKVEVISASTRVFFKVGKSTLRSDERYKVRLLLAKLVGKKNINITVISTRPKTARASLGRQRSAAVINYLKTQNIVASYSTSNAVGTSRAVDAPQNNRVTIRVTWANY